MPNTPPNHPAGHPPNHPTTQALLSIIGHAAQPMGVSDPNLPDHPMIAVNTAFETLTGYPSRAVIGQNCRFLQGPGTDPDTPRRIKACLDAKRGCIEWIVNHRQDGAKFWNLLFLVPVFAPDGALLHYFANQRDMTAEVPQELPDYVLGLSDLPPESEAAFHALLHDTLANPGPDAATALERGIEVATRLNEITLNLKRASAWQ